jgi:hypothetical protein
MSADDPQPSPSEREPAPGADKTTAFAGEAGAGSAEMKTSPFEPPAMDRIDLSDDHRPPKPARD